MNTERSTERVTIDIEEPIGNYLVCVEFNFEENAEAAVRLLKSKGIEAKLYELRSNDDPDDAPDGDPYYFSAGMAW